MKKQTLCWTVLISTLLVLSGGFRSPVFAQQEDRSGEINEYMKILNTGNSGQRARAAKSISTSGLTDKRLFDIINERLLNGYKVEDDSRNHISEMVWYCKALASSGRMEYRSTIEQVAVSSNNRKLSKHAWKNVHLFAVFAERNELMKDKSFADKGLSPDMALSIAMIKSDVLRFRKDGVKKLIKRRPADNEIYGIINEEIIKNLDSLSNDRDYIDMMAWLCKALGESGMPQYRETLQKVFDESGNGKLKKYAKKSLERLKADSL